MFETLTAEKKSPVSHFLEVISLSVSFKVIHTEFARSADPFCLQTRIGCFLILWFFFVHEK